MRPRVPGAVPRRNPTSGRGPGRTNEPAASREPARRQRRRRPIGQPDPDLRAAAGPRCRLDRAAVELDEAAGDRQARARSRSSRRRGRTARRRAAAAPGRSRTRCRGRRVSIGRGARRPTGRSERGSAGARLDRDPAAGRGVAEGVGDEVGDDLADPDRIDVERAAGRRRPRSRRSTPAAAAAGREGRRDVGDEDAEVGRLAMERQGARLGQGERPEVLDQPIEDPRLLEDRRQVGLVGRMDAVEDRLDAALDDGERRPQLVGDVGEERPALGLVGLEPGGHRVEAAGEGADRRRDGPTVSTRARVVAGLDPRRLIDEGVEDRPGAADRAGRPDEADDERRRRRRSTRAGSTIPSGPGASTIRRRR